MRAAAPRPKAASHSFAPSAARREGRARCLFVEADEFGPCAACGAGEPPLCDACEARGPATDAAVLRRLSDVLAARPDARRGDLIQLAWCDYRNDGSFIYDGRGAAALCHDVDDYGGVPPEYLVPTQFPVGYWAEVVAHNEYEWLDTAALRPPVARYGAPGIALAAPRRPRPSVVYAPFEHAGTAYCVVLDAARAQVLADPAAYVAALDSVLARHTPLLVARGSYELEPEAALRAEGPHVLYHRLAKADAPPATCDD